MRYRISELLVVMLVAAFACAALARPTLLSVISFFSLTLLLLFAAIVLAIGRTGDARVFWIGFAVCAWLYFGLIHIPDVRKESPRQQGLELTTQILWHSYGWVHKDGVDAAGNYISYYNQYAHVGQWTWALLFGWIGGHATCFVYRRSRISGPEGRDNPSRVP